MNSEDLRDIVKVEWWEDNRYLVVFGSGNEYIVELNVMVDWFPTPLPPSFSSFLPSLPLCTLFCSASFLPPSFLPTLFMLFMIMRYNLSDVVKFIFCSCCLT